MNGFWRLFSTCGLAVLAGALSGCSQGDAEAVGASGDAPANLEVQAARPVPLATLEGRRLASSSSLLTNGTFSEVAEDGVTAWTPSEGLSLLGDNEGVDQSPALALVPATATGAVTQAVQVQAGGMYWLRGYVRTASLDGSAVLAVQAPAQPGLLRAASEVFSGDTWWTPVSFEFRTPVDTVEVRLEVESAGTGSPVAFFDAIELYRLDVPAPGNLLLNASFESEAGYTEHWRKIESFAVEPSDDTADGKVSMKVVVQPGQDLDIYQAVTVQPGATYELAGMVKTEDLEGPVQLEVRDLRRGYRAFIHHSEPLTGTNGWTYLVTTFTVPQQTDLLAVFLRRPLTGTSGKGTIWFDNYRLTQLGNPG